MIDALTLWAPGLLNRLRVKEASEALQQLKLPGLQTLIAKGDHFPVKTQNFYEQASYLFHQPACLPIAATKASMEIAEFDTKLFWLSVDPVQMIPDRDSLVLVSADHLEITDDESKQLIETFNAHFAEDGVQLVWGSNKNWYLSIVQPVDIKTTSLQEVDQRPVNEFYPTGNAAQYWRQLINEAQMLFYTHPVNEKRREKGWPEINSVWVWGEGKVQNEQIKYREDAVIWSSNTYLQGQAGICKAQNKPSPRCFSEWFAQLEGLHKKGLRKHLIMLDDVVQQLDNLQLEEWVTVLQQLERDWFLPMSEALKKGQLQSVLLDLGCEYRCHLKPGHMRRFWRFSKALHKI